MNSTETSIRQHFVDQAKACDMLGSPFTATLCRAAAAKIDATSRTGRRVLDWPGDPRADALALRLCGGLHRLVLSDADPVLKARYPPHSTDASGIEQLLPDVVQRNDANLFAALDSAPQTNEIGRSGMLLPGFLHIAARFNVPLELHEIGSSAGLNLFFDRFHYEYGDRRWGDPASPVRLAPEVRGKIPPLDGEIRIASRAGCDIAPIDISKPDSRLRLRSYVWPDQTDRLERLDGAIEIAERASVAIDRKDAADFVSAGLTERRKGAGFVLFHSIMWQYMPKATRQAISRDMSEAGEAAGADAPLAWLRMEPGAQAARHAVLSLTVWPGGETQHLADCDYHGRWIEWAG